MKNAIIAGIMAASILIAGCGKESSSTPKPSKADTAPIAHAPERAIVTKAKSIVLPEFRLDGVTLQDAIGRLYIAGKQNDPEGKGVNFMATPQVIASASPKITLALKNITLDKAAERLAKAAGVSISIEDFAFAFNPKSDKP